MSTDLRTGIVIVNYNCAPLAVDAALSALGDDPKVNVVIVDNASTDNSMRFFREVFSEGREHRPTAPAQGFTQPIFADLSALSCNICLENDAVSQSTAQLTVLNVEDNDGFAAGCNIGIRYLQAAADPDIFLLLNPDALLVPGALQAFRDRLNDPAAGLCGASVLRFENPAIAQAFGGAKMNALTCLGRNIGAGQSLDDAPNYDVVEKNLSYPLGAAMAFRKDYLEVAGFLDQRFFLYYEEADWARRGGALRRPVWAREAVIYHRHGATAGSRQRHGGRSVVSDYHMVRSRMLYAMKWSPFLWPILFAFSVLQSIRRVLRGQFRQAKAVLVGALPGTAMTKFFLPSVSR